MADCGDGCGCDCGECAAACEPGCECCGACCDCQGCCVCVWPGAGAGAGAGRARPGGGGGDEGADAQRQRHVVGAFCLVTVLFLSLVTVVFVVGAITGGITSLLLVGTLIVGSQTAVASKQIVYPTKPTSTIGCSHLFDTSTENIIMH
ncbi:Protein of unknown function [Gryllus bimaculatus]|nr:Protein of unknown function [Gryllus bimaculatus]